MSQRKRLYFSYIKMKISLKHENIETQIINWKTATNMRMQLILICGLFICEPISLKIISQPKINTCGAFVVIFRDTQSGNV